MPFYVLVQAFGLRRAALPNNVFQLGEGCYGLRQFAAAMVVLKKSPPPMSAAPTPPQSSHTPA